MSTPNPNSPHPGEEELELYALNRISNPQNLERIEEHLLVCEHCRAALEELDIYVKSMERGLAEWREKEGKSAPFRASLILRSFRTKAVEGGAAFVRPGWRVAVTAAAVAVGVIGFSIPAWQFWQPRGTDAIEQVELSAWRDSPTLGAAASSGRNLSLSLDLIDLPDRAAYDCAVVDAQGKLVWKGSARRVADHAVAETGRMFHPGQYWVRLSADGELLREYGLRVKE